MNHDKQPLSLLELIGGTVALLEAVPLLANTPPETVALAAVAWLLLRGRASPSPDR